MIKQVRSKENRLPICLLTLKRQYIHFRLNLKHLNNVSTYRTMRIKMLLELNMNSFKSIVGKLHPVASGHVFASCAFRILSSIPTELRRNVERQAR